MSNFRFQFKVELYDEYADEEFPPTMNQLKQIVKKYQDSMHLFSPYTQQPWPKRQSLCSSIMVLFGLKSPQVQKPIHVDGELIRILGRNSDTIVFEFSSKIATKKNANLFAKQFNSLSKYL